MIPNRPRLRVRPDARVLRGETLVVRAHHRAEAGRVLDEPVLLVDRDRRERRGQADRVAAVGQAAVEHLRLEVLGDGGAHRDGAQRQVRAGQALGHRHEVRRDAPFVDGEPVAGPAEAGHDLVGDHEDAVPVADLADAGDVAVGRDEDAVRADDRLEEDGGDGPGALVADDVLEALEGLADRPRLRLAPAMGVRVADDADDARLVGPAARIAGQRHGPQRGAVVRAVASQDLVLAAVVAGELDGVLDRLGATEREEHLVHVARQDLGELGTRAGPGSRSRTPAGRTGASGAWAVMASMTRRSP